MINTPDEILNPSLRLSVDEIKSAIYKTTTREWEQTGQKSVIKLFKAVSQRVPAYKDFLKKNHIDPQKINTYADFQQIPIIDKKTYIDQYNLKDLVWDGDLNKNFIINTSSGTTGQPYFWPCSEEELLQGARLHEILYSNFDIDKRSTLVIVCFGMGTWIAGLYTFLSTHIAARDYNMNIITPGFSKEETIRIIENLGPLYEQIIIAGYPTFVKDVLEQWKNVTKQSFNFKFLFAAEGFTESWRDYISRLVNNPNLLTDSVNILGSADAALMGFETPLSIFIRRIAANNISLNKILFGEERVPSVENYFPTHKFYEVMNQELIISTNRALPLIKYNMHDYGGVIQRNQLDDLCEEAGCDLDTDIRLNNLSKFNHNLPFVYLFGRGKFAATIYAANIYPENVREVLTDKYICSLVTGKFTLETKYKDNHDHYLNINVELAENIKFDPSIASRISAIFIKRVPLLNSEYSKVLKEYGKKVEPQITLYHYGDARLFPKEKLKKIS